MTQAGGLDDYSPDVSIDGLLQLLSSLSGQTKKNAISAAIKAVLAQQECEARAPEGSISSGDVATCLSDGTAAPGSERLRPQDEVLPDFNACLDAYPRCQRLVQAFRCNRNTQNKTPLSIVHEHATRLGLELTYVESAESQLGPFTVEAKLTSVGGGVLYACGSGRGRGKKDAKQVAAAALLESLLNQQGQSEADFLQPGKAKLQKAVQVRPASLGQVMHGVIVPGVCCTAVEGGAGKRSFVTGQAKAQRRWQSGRARLADCKSHLLPAYSASGLQFIGDSTCCGDSLFAQNYSALAASDALAASAVPGFCDAQSLFSGGLYAGGALAASEAACAPRCLSLPEFSAPTKLVHRMAGQYLCIGALCSPWPPAMGAESPVAQGVTLRAEPQGVRNGFLTGELFNADTSAVDNGYAHCANPLASQGIAQCAPPLPGFIMPFLHPTGFPCQLPY